MKKLTLISILVLSANLYAHDLKIKMSLSPAGSFEAKTSKLKGEVKKSNNAFSAENLWVKVEELKTGIDLRDEHFHKHLNFEKSPKITLTQVTAANGKGTGTLTVNDVKKAVDFSYKMTTPSKLEATFKVKPSDFKLKDAKYMEIGVDDVVEIIATIDV